MNNALIKNIKLKISIVNFYFLKLVPETLLTKLTSECTKLIQILWPTTINLNCMMKKDNHKIQTRILKTMFYLLNKNDLKVILFY